MYKNICINTEEECDASIENIKEYSCLCLLEESQENLQARCAIILKQRAAAHKRVEEAKATAKYMDDKMAHYEAILAELAPNDTDPKNWTAKNRPEHSFPFAYETTSEKAVLLYYNKTLPFCGYSLIPQISVRHL